MKETMQLSLEGGEIYPPIEFDCPLCGKHIMVKRDEKGNAYHRSWVYHWMYDHINPTPRKLWKKIEDSIPLWLYYYTFHDQDTAKELVEEWKEKIGE